jgi:hypothetical protein
MHEYLVQILGQAPDIVLQKARDAEERLRFWMNRTKTVFATDTDRKSHTLAARIRSFFAKPIPFIESLRLWRFARSDEERRMLARNLRGFGLQMALLMIFLLPVFVLVGWRKYLESRHMGKLVVNNPVGAQLILTCIYHYAKDKTCPAEVIPLQGASIYLEGPVDYLLIAQQGEGRAIQYPVYIHDYTHQIEVTIHPPPAEIPDGMVYIPGGVFRMGYKDDEDGMGDKDECPQHDVNVDGFFMDQHEVTNALYQQCVETGVCSEPHYEDETCYRFTEAGWIQEKIDPVFQEPNKPVVCVDWLRPKPTANIGINAFPLKQNGRKRLLVLKGISGRSGMSLRRREQR